MLQAVQASHSPAVPTRVQAPVSTSPSFSQKQAMPMPMLLPGHSSSFSKNSQGALSREDSEAFVPLQSVQSENGSRTQYWYSLMGSSQIPVEQVRVLSLCSSTSSQSDHSYFSRPWESPVQESPFSQFLDLVLSRLS